MNKNTIFIIGLIGSILGIVGSLVWLFFGTFFIAGILDAEQPLNAPPRESSLWIGFMISASQSVTTIAMFIITLVKSLPSSLEKNLRKNGIWLLTLGIIGIIINAFHFIPLILVIVAGSLALAASGRIQAEHQSGSETF